MKKIKKGDQVIILAGKDKSKVGKVLAVFSKINKVIVENVQMVKKTVKSNPQSGKAGGIIEKESKIDFSNIAIFNPLANKADRIKITFDKDTGKKVREFKSSSERVDIGR